MVREVDRVVRIASRVNLQSVEVNRVCIANRLTIDLMRSRPVHPRCGGVSKRVRTVPPRREGESKNLKDMLGHLQKVLDDIHVNQDADEPSGDQIQQTEEVSFAEAYQICLGTGSTVERFGSFNVSLSEQDLISRGTNCKGSSGTTFHPLL